MNCKNCNAILNEETYFCLNCGEFISDIDVRNKTVLEKYQSNMKSIIQSLNSKNEISIGWNQTVEKYVETISKLKNVIQMAEFDKLDKESILKRFDNFIERCKTPEFHIAFVGTIKAGKSTLINSLLGSDLASTSVTPETAVLTKFRYCKEGNYVKVKFYNDDEWNALWNTISNNADVFLEEYRELEGDKHKSSWLNREEYIKFVEKEELEDEIEVWSSSKKVEHYFVKEVEVGLNDFVMPEQVVFVDTPGLDDAVRYRSDVTRNYIDRANAVFACVKSDALTGNELNTLYRIFSNTSYNPEKVYVIGTQWDLLNNPKADWELQKKEWTKYLSKPDCYGKKEIANRNILYSAAHVNNLIRDYEKLDQNNKFNLFSFGMKFQVMPDKIESELENFLEMTNINKINSVINLDIVGRYSEYLHQDILQSYKDIKKDVGNLFTEIRNTQNEILDASKKSLSEIKEQYQSAENELKEIQGSKLELDMTLKLVKEDTERRVETLCKELRALVK